MNQHEKNSGRSSTNQLRMLGYAGLLAIMLASASPSRAQSTAPFSSAQKKAALAAEYGRLPLSFEKNEGQADPRVKFLAHGQGYTLSLTRDGALLILHRGTDPTSKPESEATPQIRLAGANANPTIVGTDELPGKVNYLLGNDPKKWRTNLPTFAQVLYKDVYPGIDLVFHGNQGKLEFDFVVRPGADPNLIQIKDPGVNSLVLNPAGDLAARVFRGEILIKKPVTYQEFENGRRELASNFVVKNDGRIAIRVAAYDRSKPLVIDPQLVYSTFVDGVSTLPIRSTAIAVDGLGEAIVTGQAESTYSVTSGAFEGTQPFLYYSPFVAKFNATGTALVYATYLGGVATSSQGPDGITAVAADSAGNAYLTGGTTTLDFPVTSTAFQATPPCLAANQTQTHLCKASSAFVTVINPTGAGLVYSTYFGGTTGIPVGQPLVATALVPFASFIPADTGTGITVDASGNIYVTGLTSSSDFPVTAGAPQTAQIVESSLGFSRVSFIAKLNPASSGTASLIYSTCLGASGNGADTDAGGIAVDPQGNAYVTGVTLVPPPSQVSQSFPTTPGAFETVIAPIAQLSGASTSFVTKLNSLGTQFSYSTFYQGGIVNGYQDGSQTNAQAIAVDAAGSAYITGYTNPDAAGIGGVPTTLGAFQPSCDMSPSVTSCSQDAFVAKFSPDGSALIYSTYLGGSGVDLGFGIAVDSQGHAIVVGQTSPDNDQVPNTFPTTPDAFQVTCPSVSSLANGCGINGFLTVMSVDGSSLVYSTFLGGTSGNDQAYAVAVDSTGSSYLTGYTESTDFPVTPGVFAGSLKQTQGGFVMKFGSSALSPLTVLPNALPSGAVGIVYGPITFTQTGGTGSITWSTNSVLPTGITFVSGVLEGIPTQPGTFPITITATDSTGNMGSASLSLFIYPATSATISAQSCSSAPITSFDFGSVAVGTTSPQYICLNNTGSSNLYISFSTLLPSTPVFNVASESCNILQSTPPSATNGVAPGTSCTVTVDFSPTTVGPSAPVELSFSDNAGSQTVTLTGTGLARTTAILSLAPCSASAPSITTLNFGNVPVGTTQTQTVCVTNTGSSNPLYIEAIFPPIVPPFLPVSNSCPVLEGATPTSSNGILPGNSCQLVISFTPTGVGTSSGIGFQVYDNAGNQPLMLTGTGVAPGPTLVSIAVTPVNPTISVSGTQQFAATGTYSDSSTQNITTSVNWSSTSTSSTTVATINSSSGLATGVAAGTSTIQATLGSATPGSTTLTVTTSTGGGAPACGCSKTGAYVSPMAPVAPSNPATSPNDKYSVSASGTSEVSITVTRTSDGRQVLSTTAPSDATDSVGWLFSPDDDRFVINEVNGSTETVFIYNLAGGSSSPVTTITGTALGTDFGFSPSGQYFSFENLTASSSTTLSIFNVLTGKKVYSNSFSFSSTPGSGADTFGVVGLSGFSPDNPETSFVYAFQTGQNSPQMELVHLEQSPLSNTNGSATTLSPASLIAAFWQFSPCGDVLAIFPQASGNFAEIQFIRTVDGVQVQDFSGVPVGNITVASSSTQQVATDVTSSGTQTYTVDNGTNNLGCSAQNVPQGSNVTVQPAATGTVPAGTSPAPVTLNFPTVNSPGGQITLSESNTGTAPPNGFALGTPPVYYDLTETPSPLPTTGTITICINYTGITFTGAPQLFHLGNNITLGPPASNPANNIICGSTSSLSPFAIFGAAGPVSTTTALTSSQNTSVDGQTITLTAQITPSLVGAPTGTVTFSDGATVLGSGPLASSGSAIFSTSLLPAGTDSITAVYSGDTYFAGSTSSALALTVTPAPLTVTANSVSRQYGASDPTFTAAYSGFVNGDGPGALSGTLTCTAGDTASSPVGTYAINCSGLSSSNYSITFLPGTLSVTPAPLTITANNVSRPYGQPNPSSFGVTYSGFVNGDTSSSLSGVLSCTTPAVATSPLGTYPITCTGLTSSNYAITFVPGTLTVIKEVLSITAKFISIAQASNGNYIVTIAVTNNGDITANKVASGIMIGNLIVPGGSLGDTADISSIPALNLAPGATANITLLFPASAGKPLSTRELFAYGFATANNPNGIPVLPALWVLQPAPTQVTLP